MRRLSVLLFSVCILAGLAAEDLPPVPDSVFQTGFWLAGESGRALDTGGGAVTTLGRIDYQAAASAKIKRGTMVFLAFRIDQIDSDANWFYYFVSVSTVPADTGVGKYPREKYLLISKKRIGNFKLGQQREIFATYYGTTETEDFNQETGERSTYQLPTLLATYMQDK